MKVINPLQITAASIVSTTVPEAEYGQWVAGTTYALANRVIRNHCIFESLRSANTGNDPSSTSGYWLNIGPTNAWAMFDERPSVATTATTSMQVTLTPGACTDLALFGVIGTSIELYKGASKTHTIAVPAPTSPSASSTVAITGLTISPSDQLGIKVIGSAGATVQVSSLSVGAMLNLGATVDGASIELIDDSKIATDDFGVATITRRGYRRRVRASVSILASAADTTEGALRSLTGVVTYWACDESSGAFILQGLLQDWQLTYSNKVSNVYTATVLGLTRDDAAISPGAQPVGQDIKGAAFVQLSQPSILLPASAAGAVTSFSGAVSSFGVVQAGIDASDLWTFERLDTGCVSAIDTAARTVAITSLPGDTGTVDVTARRAGFDAVTARISVGKVRPGADGLAGLTVVMSPETVSLPADAAGSVSSYSGSGFVLTVQEGSTSLTASAAATVSAFRIGAITQTPAATLTPGAISYSGTAAAVADHSAMTTASSAVTLSIPITIYRSNGSAVSFTKVQTITKAKTGAVGAAGAAGAVGASGQRGSVTLARQITGSAWADAEAGNALTAAGYAAAPITGDVVTLFNTAAVPPFSQARVYLSATWQVLAQHLNGALIVDGTVQAGALAANSVTTRSLLVKGSQTINDDPNFVDPTAWALIGAGTTFATSTAAAGAMGQSFVTNSTGATDAKVNSRRYPIDPSATYSLTALFFSQAGNNRNMYLYARMFDAAGAELTGATTGWGGAYAGYVFGGVPAISDQWTRVGGQFGATISGRPIPTNARFIEVGVWMQYSGTGTTSLTQGCMNLCLTKTVGSADIEDAAITNAKIGNVIYSTNFNGTIAADGSITANGTTGWAISKSGSAIVNNLRARGAVMGGAYTMWGWPAAGAGGGFYLGSEGLLLGSESDGKYFEVTSAGDIYAPGLSVVNGVLTISAANVINTLQISGGAVTETFLAQGGATTSITITVPSGQTWQITSLASANGTSSTTAPSSGNFVASVLAQLKYDAAVVDSANPGATATLSTGQTVSASMANAFLQHTAAYVGPISVVISCAISGSQTLNSASGKICVLATKR